MDTPAEFRPRTSFPRFAAPFLPPLVLFFLVMLLLGAILTGSSAGGAAVGALGVAVLALVLAARHRALTAGTVLRLGPDGVTLRDAKGFRVRLAWADVTRIGPVETRMASPRRIGRPGGLRVRAGALRSHGLIGWGERELPPRIPGWLRERLAAVPTEPGTGRPEVAIPLGDLDPGWAEGPIGAWVRRYRPDLLGSAPSASGRS
ncbi:hypothetical protein [Bailinhaonella thermotolerans]|uniref:PH domain-containing protein n=1 Tax=Bailinhaonella thermotolerans TaxID=1070861 RepID=A0A3A4AX20_9ACTN|nr:hypothetical protein [Bailinhaonella thermotolerans]RJL30383.1 hypothetical protein D5H75_22680 [Bailinhaonella thermotolerans]